MTYGNLLDQTLRTAEIAKSVGLGPGHCVATILPFAPTTATLTLGLMSSTVVAPVNPSMPSRGVVEMVGRLRPKMIVVEPATDPVVRESALEQGVLVAELRPVVGGPVGSFELDMSWPRIASRARILPPDLALVLPTSGTTSASKLVPLSHERLRASTRSVVESLNLGTQDCALHVMPMHHIGGIVDVLLAPLSAGGEVTFSGPFAATTVACAIQDGQSTWLQVAPAMLRELLERIRALPGEPSSHRLRLIRSVSAPLGVDLLHEAESLLGVPVIEIYGMTETGGVISSNPLSARRPGTVGVPVGCELRIASSSGEDAEPGDTGEIQVRAPGLMRGYVDDGESAALAGGWLPTGDVGVIDGDGYLTITGRVKDVVNRGGEMLSLASVDRALMAHPDVVDVAAFAVPHPTLGEAVASVVVAREGAGLNSAALLVWLADRVPYSMIPRPIVFLTRIPRVNGKLRRSELAALIPPTPQPDDLDSRTALQKALASVWCRVLGLDRLSLDDDFFALGGDSLRAAALVAELSETTSDIIYASSVFNAPTVRTYARHLSQHYPTAALVLGGEEVTNSRLAPITPDDIRRFDRLVVTSRAEAYRAEPATMSPLNPPVPRIAFILSAPRSGSTLLRSMLAGHPQAFAPPELYLLAYADLASRHRAFEGPQTSQLEGLDRAFMAAWGITGDKARQRLAAMQAEDASTLDAYQALHEAIRPRLLVDKTPANALDPATLARAEMVAEAPVYIHLVRHPRAMVASFEEANLASLWWPRIVGPKWDPSEAPIFTARQLGELLWVHMNRTIASFLGSVSSDRVATVRFEDLVSDPKSALSPVCDLLGIDFSPALLDPYDDSARRMTDGLVAGSRMIGDPKFHQHRGIDPRVGDRWKNAGTTVPLSAETETLARSLGYRDADSLPLTPGEHRLWTLAQVSRDTTALTVPMVLRFTGRLEVPQLRETLAHLQLRHDALRARFPTILSGAPTVLVDAEPQVILQERDLGSLATTRSESRYEEIDAAIEACLNTPFDVVNGPLWCADLLHAGVNEAFLVLAFHHLVFDGLSRRVLQRELFEAYSSLVDTGNWNPEPVRPSWQQVRRALHMRDQLTMRDSEQYWRTAFADPAPPLQIPSLLKGEGTSRTESTVLTLPSDVQRQVNKVAHATEATANSIWLAATVATLHRWTGQTDLLVGVPTSGRATPGADQLVGYFNRLMPLRIRLSKGTTGRALVQQVSRRVLEVMDHDSLSVQDISRLMGFSAAPLNKLLVEYQDGYESTRVLPGVEASTIHVRKRTPDFELAVHVQRMDDKVVLVVDADESVLGPDFSSQFASALVETVGMLECDLDAVLATMPSLGVAADEVANALLTHPMVATAVAILRAESGAVDAYVILKEGDVPTIEDLRGHLASRLPAYRQPAHLMSVGVLPKKADGAIDVDRLPSGMNSRPVSDEQPRDDLEREIADAWRRVLWSHHPFGIHDSFREEGGHSLLAVQLVASLEERWGRQIPVEALPHLDTIAGFAGAIRNAPEAVGASQERLPEGALAGMLAHTSTWRGVRHREGALIVGLNLDGSRVPLFWCLQNSMEHEALARWLGSDQPVYGLRSANRVMEKTDQNIDLLAQHYVDEITEIYPSGPVALGGNCQAARIALRIARRLVDAGRHVPILMQMEKFEPYPYRGAVAFLFGDQSDRDPYQKYIAPEIGYAKYIDGEMWIRYIKGPHGHFFEEPNIQVLAATVEEHLDVVNGGPAVPGELRPIRHDPLSARGYRAALSVDRAPSKPLRAGAIVDLDVTVTNLSEEVWLGGSGTGLTVAARWYVGSERIPKVAAAVPLPLDLEPGGQAVVSIEVPTPNLPGAVQLEIDMVDQGISWFNDKGSASERVNITIRQGWGSRVGNFFSSRSAR